MPFSRAHTRRSRFYGQRGQGLVEYLIVVSLMAVASIAVVRALSQVVQSRFRSVASGLQGDRRGAKVQLDESLTKRKDMGNFFDGVEAGGSGASGGSGGASDGR